MRLILRDAVEHLGQAGDIVTVKPGYARNYLIPRALAYRATEANIRRIEDERRVRERRAQQARKRAQRRRAHLKHVTLTFVARALPADPDAGDTATRALFGSVSARDILARVQELDLGFDLELRSILLDEPIKTVGEHLVRVRLHAEVEIDVTVVVVAEEG